MGCVLPAGQGQAPARQAGFAAGLDESVPATTLNKMCGSGMKAAMIGLGSARARWRRNGGRRWHGVDDARALPAARDARRGPLGHAQAIDHMFLDGLEDAYAKGRLMGTFAEDCAEAFQFTREAQDDYALASLSRALEAQGSGAFAAEIAPVDRAHARRTDRGDRR